MDGKIFDIQRFSIYDGPGIRTNIFFKGCNLRCLWCHNPESQSMKNELMINADKCTHCGECAKVCTKAFTADCTACGECVKACAHEARKIKGETITAEKAAEAALRDKEFYKTSGGGVTLSGGEPLLQPDFAAEILRICKENGVHTAIETALCVKWESVEKVLPYLDLVLCDIKCMDEKKHIELTGVSNKLILENAEKLKKSGVRVIFRTPVIPTCNDDEIEKIAAFCEGFDYEILAYHKTGCGKYTSLGREYTLPDVEPPSVDFMKDLAAKCGAQYNPTGV